MGGRAGGLWSRAGLDPGCLQPSVILGRQPVVLLGVLLLGGGGAPDIDWRLLLLEALAPGSSGSWVLLLLETPAAGISYSLKLWLMKALALECSRPWRFLLWEEPNAVIFFSWKLLLMAATALHASTPRGP